MKSPGLRPSRLLWVILIGTWGLSPGPAGAAEPSIFRRSLVPAWFDGLDDHRRYNVDLLVQDMDLVDELDILPWRKFVRDRQAEGKLFFAEMSPITHADKMLEYAMKQSGLQGAACLDLELRPIPIPWMVGHTYQGKTPPFLCSNHPAFRAFLRQQVFLFTEVGVDGIMIDDAGGTFFAAGHGGCFCEYCVKGFRQYLREKYPASHLRERGVDDGETFDYRAFVLRRVPDLATYRKEQRQIPWNTDFRDFLLRSDVALFTSLQQMATKLRGKHMPVGWDNVDFGGNRAPYYHFWDVFYSEINYQNFAVPGRGPDEVLPPGIVMLDKLAEALGKFYTPTPAPRSWQAIMEKNLTGLLRQWIALSYANGSALRYPRKGWVFSASTPWYYPPQEAFEPLYHFVRTHRELFDDYEAVKQVGVLFTQSASGGGAPYYSPLKHVCAGLVQANVPFGFAVAGDELLSNRLTGSEANRFELMLIPEPARLIDGQQAIVDRWKRENKAVAIPLAASVEAAVRDRVRPLVSLASTSAVWLFARRTPGGAGSVVCHLVGSNFDAATNRVRPQRNVAVRLRHALCGGRPVQRVTYHPVEGAPQPLATSADGDATVVTVPMVELWGLLKIEPL